MDGRGENRFFMDEAFDDEPPDGDGDEQIGGGVVLWIALGVMIVILVPAVAALFN